MDVPVIGYGVLWHGVPRCQFIQRAGYLLPRDTVLTACVVFAYFMFYLHMVPSGYRIHSHVGFAQPVSASDADGPTWNA